MPPNEEKAKEEMEYQHVPIPMDKRLGFQGPALVWSGFGIAFICAVIGGIIQQSLGTINGIIAIIIGNLILFLYSAVIGYTSGEHGINFPLTVRYVFGDRGAFVPIVLLSLLVTGWFAFQAWLVADIVRVAFGLQGKGFITFLALLACIIFAIPVIFGIKQMILVRKIAIPAMILFVLYYIITRVFPEGKVIFSRVGTGELSFLTCVGMAWSTFVVSGTMTGDIVRYTKSGKQAVGVTAIAFVASNAPFMIIGALIAAAQNDPTIVYFFDAKSLGVLIPLVVLAVLSNWSTCDACLYNASMGFSNSLNFNWKTAAIIGTIIGLILAGTGVIANIVNWLTLLGLLVPPIGGTIIADYYLIRGTDGFKYKRDNKYNLAAIIAMLVGIALGYWVFKTYPNFLFGIPGIVSSFVVYLILAKAAPAVLGSLVGTEEIV